MEKERIRFHTIGEFSVNPNKKIVVSVSDNKKATISQKVVVKDEDNNDKEIFLKNTVVMDLSQLEMVIEMLTDAHDKLSKEEALNVLFGQKTGKKIKK